MTSSPAPAPEGSQGRLVQQAVTRIVRWASRYDVRAALVGPAGQGLSPTDTWLLAAVADDGPVRASDLARWQGVDKSTVTAQVKRLQVRGLIAGTPDPSDGRAVLLAATDQGHELRQELAATGAGVFDAVLGSWPEQDQQAFAELLARFAEQLTYQGPARLQPRARAVTEPRDD